MTTLIPKFDLMNGGSTPSGAINRFINEKLVEWVSVKDFGAKGDGTTDDTTALQAARDYIASNPNTGLTFPGGTYLYTVSPNWAIQNVVIQAIGKVVLKYSGTGNCVILDSGATGGVNNFQMLGNFIVLGTSASQNGIYLRSVSRSKIQARIAGCGTNYAGLRTEFSVCSEFWVVVSSNEQSFGTAIPKNGYYLSSRASNEQTSDCTFYNPIVEGVSADGIYLDNARKNNFIGGTSEGIGGWGVYVVSGNGCSLNTFNGIDIEAATLGGIYDGGYYNSYINCLGNSIQIASGSTNIEFIGGQYGSIINAGDLTLHGVSYTGSITNTGKIAKTSVYNITSATYDLDIKLNSFQNLQSIPNATATTVITLPSSGNYFYQVYAYYLNGGGGNSYAAYAVIYKSVGSAAVYLHQDGVNVAITLSGLNIQVTQTTGSSLLIQTVAQVI